MTGGEKGKKTNKQKTNVEMKMNKKKTVLEKWKRRKMGQPTEFFSLLCFVFFIYKKGKHQKWCLNIEGEIVGGVGHFSRWPNTSECLQHACTLIWSLTFDLWPLACPPRSPHSGGRSTILECFIASLSLSFSLYSISWQNVSHLIFPQWINFQ